jgi:hypothetical protein
VTHVSSSSDGDGGFTVLTPYLIPDALHGIKTVNLGDGFILRAIERLVGPILPERQLSSRVAPTDQGVRSLAHCSAVILAGANQLSDSYTIWPGLTAELIKKQRLRLVPFGIGLHGEPGRSEHMSDETRSVLEAVHERIEFSSWRCPRTIAFLQRELPHLAGRFLMTGCPVLYDRPLLESDRFHCSESAIAVTATERGEFWERETQVIDAVAKRFPRSRRYFVVHQNFSPPRAWEGLRHRLMRSSTDSISNSIEGLRFYARRHGFRIVIPRNADECIRFYEGIDIHVGSRLHAHLLVLSRNKRSYLVAVDGRSLGMAEHLGFPLSLPQQLDKNWDFDFEIVREEARQSYMVMERFVRSLPRGTPGRGSRARIPA